MIRFFLETQSVEQRYGGNRRLRLDARMEDIRQAFLRSAHKSTRKATSELSRLINYSQYTSTKTELYSYKMHIVQKLQPPYWP